MKKTILLLLTTTALFFTSCFNSVYYNILQDVPPENATVSGAINSLVRYNAGGTEFLVCAADKGLRYKKASENYHSTWNIYSDLPFQLHSFDYIASAHTGQQIIKVLADSKYLYILSVSYTINIDLGTTAPENVYLYAKEIKLNDFGTWDSTGSWTLVASGVDLFKFSIYNSYYYSDFNAFCTNSVQNKNRKAYIRSGDATSHLAPNQATTYYELNGLSAPVKISITPFDSADINNINSAAVLNNQTYFLNTQAVTTNETLTQNATYLYFGEASTLYYSDGIAGTDHTKIAVANCGTVISSLATTKDSILIGRGDYSESVTTSSGGITKTSLDENGVPGNILLSFTTNAQIQLSASYLIFTLLNVDPSQTELNSSIYSSIGFVGSGSSTSSSVNYNNIGLWSYYPIRGNWNRE